MWSLMRENSVWDICAFVPSKAGLTKEVIFHEGGLSKEVLLYLHTAMVHSVHSHTGMVNVFEGQQTPLLSGKERLHVSPSIGISEALPGPQQSAKWDPCYVLTATLKQQPMHQ